MSEPILDIKNLSVEFNTLDGLVNAVSNFNVTLAEQETLAIVGESGSGKTQSMLAILGLLAKNGRATGEINFAGKNLLALNTKALNTIRGKQIAMIFQDPMTSLNPYLRVSTQLTEVLKQHEGMNHRDATARALDMLDLVKIPDAKNRLNSYPHEFSGGMRQRVAIAMSLLCHPKIIIADEPTTALDVTVEAQILHLLRDIKLEFNSSIIMITHDLGVVANFCDRVLVMYAGRAMEQGTLDDIFYRTQHPYTKGLLKSVPDPHLADHQPLYSIPGNPPNLVNPPPGCPFAPRCKYRLDDCTKAIPPLITVSPAHSKACIREDLA